LRLIRELVALGRHSREDLSFLVIPAKAGIQCLGFAFRSNAFAFGELLFFEGLQRKGNQKKAAFPTELNRQSESSSDFQTRHPWLG